MKECFASKLIDLGYNYLIKENDKTIWLTKNKRVTDKTKFDGFSLNEKEMQDIEGISNGDFINLKEFIR